MSAILDPNNRLFELARNSKRLPNWIVAITMSSIFFIGGSVIGVIPLLLIFGLNDTLRVFTQATAPEFVFFLISLFVPVALLQWIWLIVIERRPFWTLGFERKGAIQKYIRGALFGIIMFSLIIIILSILGFVTFEQTDPSMHGLPVLGGVLLAYIGWAIQGAVEEITMRGWLMPVIGARYRPWLGIMVSSLVFSTLHCANLNINLVGILNIFLVGLVFALIALWEGGLWGVCGLHAAWNWAQGNLFGLEVSGLMPTSGTLINLKESGPDILTGGAFGPEAGLITTVLYLVTGVIFIMLLKRKNNL
jgi:membrane protease YdiL (CAAX protease family)